MAAGSPAFPGGNNTFVKDHDASGRLMVEYSRNPEDFVLNSYIQITDVKKAAGYYLKITPEEAARVMSGDLAEFVWPDGAPRPQRNNGTESFYFEDYETERLDFDFTIGRKAAEQADWPIVEQHSKMKAQQCMTARTTKIHGLLSDANNWPAAHTIDVATIPGNTGAWDESTTARQDIKRSINYAIEIIMLATLSAVRRKDLILVMSPGIAHQISTTQEIVDHIKGSPDAYNQVVGNQGKWGEFQLPDKLYGVQLAIEDAVRVTNYRGTARADGFIAGADECYLLARPGQLVSSTGGPSWSTTHLFVYEDMSVETKDVDDDRRTEGHVVDDYATVMTAPSSGFRFENVLASVA